MAKKKLDEALIANELRGNSLFFRRSDEIQERTEMKKEPDTAEQDRHAPHPSPLPQAVPETISSPSQVKETASDRDPYGRTGVRTDRTDVRRTITRYAYEVYQDQIETFRQLALEDKLRGGRGSMSEMIREALDDYIAKKRNTIST